MCRFLVHVLNEVSKMPDITDSEKSEIREIAGEFAASLWKIPFNDGLILYVKTNEELFIHPARWKYCLKCGIIDKKEKMENHHCLMDVREFPILIQTSWFKLKAFFLGEEIYMKFLKDAGIDDLPKQVPISIKSQNGISESRDTKTPVSEKESI